jgi:hypothetical protein
MLEGVDFGEVDYVLEPSAGKGDICDYIKGQKERVSIDVIEIEKELQLILKGKKYHLIHDDFLSFQTSKKYDLIVANFPFSDGDQHLQKALEVLETYGGVMVCLVNAETIRNPFSNLRRSVVYKLESYRASIEYLQNQFTDAERKTDVEIALVRVSVEDKSFKSLILDSLKKSEEIEASENAEGQIVETDFIKALVSRFRVECELGVKLIEEYFSLKPYIVKRMAKKGEKDPHEGHLIKLEIQDSTSDNKGESINNYLRGVRHKYWEILIGDERFRGRYTSNILKDLQAKLSELRDYDFTSFNIGQLQEDLNKNIVLGIEDAILKLFDDLSAKFHWNQEFGKNVHYYNGWKTNKAYKINKKVILPINGFSSYSYGKDALDNYYLTEKLEDMIKVFNYMSGEIAEDRALIQGKIKEANETSSFRDIGFHYFETTFFKKGTCHIKFKDEKLLDKFNIFGSQRRGWLPPSYGKKAYRDMSDEEKQVVNEFQGQEKYDEVVNQKDYYLVETNKLLLN